MKNNRGSKRRINNRHSRRKVTALLCLCMVLALVGGAFVLFAEAKNQGTYNSISEIENGDQALHFYIRHWHSEEVNDLQYQDGSTESVGRYYVVAEGYIVPKNGITPSPSRNVSGGFDFYFVNQNEDRTLVWIDSPDDTADGSDYIKEIDTVNGSITLQANPVKNEDKSKNVENFAGFSISAGHDAVTYNNDDSITITYDYYVHLVKGHAFYIRDSKKVHGYDDEDKLVLGIVDDDNTSLEMDTVEVYVYTGEEEFSYEYDDKEIKYKKGDIIKINKDGNLVACTKKSDLPPDLAADDAELTKFYSTVAGLHTDKTATAHNDGRTFDLELESWYTEGLVPEVAMILDASGSMAFASDEPMFINVLDALGVKEDGNGWYTYTNGKSITDPTLTSLLNKVGALKREAGAAGAEYVYPQRKSMVGYYEIRQNSVGDNRTWFLNTVAGGDPAKYDYSKADKNNFAKFVKQPSINEIDFSGSMTLINCNDYNGATKWGDVPINFKDNSGLNLAYYNKTNDGESGFLLESASKIKDGDFTLSFTIAGTASSPVQVLYAGPEIVQQGDGFFNVILDSSGNLQLRQGTYDSVSTIQTVSGAAGKRVTFVFEQGQNGNYTVRTYLNDVAQSNNADMTISGTTIVFAPFPNENAEAITGTVYVNDIVLYTTALKDGDVKEFYSLINSGTDINKQGATSIDDWNRVFLTDKELALLLNPRKTDNSLIAASDYSYFVYDPRDNTQEYTPIGYWEGVYIPPVTPIPTKYEFLTVNNDIVKKRENLEDGEYDIRYGWADFWHSDYHMAGSNGFHLAGEDTREPSTAALLLDAKPTTSSFTISFNLCQTAADKQAEGERTIAELLYIGSLSGDTTDGGYYRLFRDQGTSSQRLRAAQSPDRKNYLTDIDKVFGTAGKKNRVTLVFDGDNNTVTAYLNGTVVDGDKNENMEFEFANDEIRIIINPFQDDYEGAPIYIDDIYVFDTALDAGNVQRFCSSTTTPDDELRNRADLIGLYEFANTAIDFTVGDTDMHPANGRTWLKNSAPKAAANPYSSEKILNKDRPDVMNNKKGSDSTITVPDAPATWDDRMLGTFTKSGSTSSGSIKPGWYYISHGGWDSDSINKTAKTLTGVVAGAMFNDKDIYRGGNNNSYDSDAYYMPEENSPIRFFVDGEYKLRCFFSRDAGANAPNGHWASYVYELDDTKYVKTESLQRAVGTFVTLLSERSPSSRVSAVRFSHKNLTREYCVLLPWTTDFNKSVSFMSLRNGKNLAHYLQNNYGLTGNTYTMNGLEAFKTELWEEKNGGNQKNDKVSKYLIIFTDGADTTDEKDAPKTVRIADELKDDDYTIFTVLLNGGPVVENGPQYEQAHEFLLSLSGTKNTKENEQREKYFFSVAKGRRQLGDAAEGMNDADILTTIFSDEILKQIAQEREDYTVKDYIDPRFDLVSGLSKEISTATNGETKILSTDKEYVIHLNANGKIELVLPESPDEVVAWLNLSNGKYYNSIYLLTDPKAQGQDRYKKLEPEWDEDNKCWYVLLNLSASDSGAEHPRLYYDGLRDMYYLMWVEQTIPGSSVGSDTLPVWHATFTIRAKEDFIGGNNVLTNGNMENLNWVFDPNDPENDANSGTSDSVPKNDTDSPSKGFPRVTVNVGLLDLNANDSEKRIYLGEVITPAEVIEELGQTLKGSHYWTDYLMRYYKYKYNGNTADMTSEELMEYVMQKLVEDPSGWGLEVPYYYLPNVVEDANGKIISSTNQPGLKGWQQDDCLGILRYRWERLDPETGMVIGVGGYGDNDDQNGNNEDEGTGPYKGKPYETLDTRRIEYRLVVSFWPFPDTDSDFWEDLEKWNGEPLGVSGITKNKLQTLLDDMWDLLEAEADKDFEGKPKSGTGGLSARVQSANTHEAMGNILGKYNDIADKLQKSGLLDKVTENGTFNTLLGEVYEALYENETTITMKLTNKGEEVEVKKTIGGGLDGLLMALDGERREADNDNTYNQALRVYIETELFKQRNEIDNMVAQMSNYIDYLRWCIGYGETDSNGNKVTEGWHEDTDKFSKRADENHELISDTTRTDKDGKNVSNDSGIKGSNGSIPEFEYAYWEPKKAVGEPQFNKTVIGMSTIRIVRGELAFELELDMNDLTRMFEFGSWKGKDSVPFYIDLKREYEDDSWSPVIPKLVIDVKKNDLEKLKKVTNGIIGEVYEDTETGVITLYYLTEDNKVTDYPKAVYYTDNYSGGDTKPGTVFFYTDPREFDPPYDDYQNNNKYARLLPIGTYTMTPSEENKADWSVFNIEMFYASGVHYNFDSWHFTRTTNEGEPNNSVESIYFPRSGRSQSYGLGQLHAPETNRKNDKDITGELIDKSLGVVFELGTHDYGPIPDEDDKIYEAHETYYSAKGIPQYTDDRSGMARVKATLDWYELPATGGDGTTVLYASGASILVICGMWLMCRKPRSGRKRSFVR